MNMIGVIIMKDDCILQKKTDVGLIRDKNEDTAFALSHPKDNAIKILGIADGMGGKDLGDVASSFVVSKITDWFKKSSTEIINNTKEVIKKLEDIIKKSNEELIKKYGTNKLGTTLSMALVNYTNTIILNIGDSRCYIYKDDKLEQVTEDDSQVWLYYKAGAVQKEDLRYFSTSNFISACIGLSKELCTPTITTISNDYDLILLLSDGVTDLLTDKKITELINKYKRKDILDRIIQEAVYVEQDLHIPLRLKRNFNEPFYIPVHGKDNASGAIYIKSSIKK